MIEAVFDWLGDMGNSKVTALLIFFTVFIGIVIYTYGSRKRGQRLETYKDIPFNDDDSREPFSK